MNSYYTKSIIYIIIGLFSIYFMKFPSYYYIKPKSGLNLRKEPSIKSGTIIVIKHDEEVFIIDDSLPEVNLNNSKGKWVKVKYDNNEGYVFSGYLEELSGTFRFIWKNILPLIGIIISFFGIFSNINKEIIRKKEIKRKDEDKKYFQKLAEEKELYLKEVAEKYGEEFSNNVRNKEVKLGMNQEFIRFMFGKPKKINLTEDSNGKLEEFYYDPYVYRNKTYFKKTFIFENGHLKEYNINK